MTLAIAIVVASGLLLLGLAARVRFRLFQVLFIPASVIGGLVGLAAIQAMTRLPPLEPAREIAAAAAIGAWGETLASTLRSWPAMLIAVVFAGLLMERGDRRPREAMRGAALAGLTVWIIVLGEVALGLAATWLIIGPALDVPPAFGQLIEAGFAGGHGTATALGAIYADVLEFPEGLDLGLFMATVGLIWSVASGIGFVNLAVRRGWTRSGKVEIRLLGGLEARHDPRPVARGRVRGEVVDPLAFQVALVALAMGAGVLLQAGFVAVVGALPDGTMTGSLERVPLFLFALIGGFLVRRAMELIGAGDLIDGESIKRVVAIAMEFLIVAAIASLRVEAVAEYFWPIALLAVLGCAWAAFCLLVLSPRLLPRAHWFELGIVNYGMSTGTTAQGLMLLRIVDRDLESGAAEEYALAAPLSAPFVGGGVITLSLPVILQTVHVGAVTTTVVLVMAALYALARGLRRAADRA